ncbi:hypothetical protein S1361_30420 [Streptomyces cyanogenus]|uniref:Uncharacterized protein n=1 Tax=Streptomyces cyanogenus TaxID=80860 RepID=A0ABX7U154_STRCY|nr:hypothetical protein S1361_30420 [Streptomyces cyanogenus]
MAVEDTRLRLRLRRTGGRQARPSRHPALLPVAFAAEPASAQPAGGSSPSEPDRCTPLVRWSLWPGGALFPRGFGVP